MKKKVDWQEEVFSVLGIFTPVDISNIAKISTGVKKVPLLDVIQFGEQILDETEEEAKEKAEERSKVISLEAERLNREKLDLGHESAEEVIEEYDINSVTSSVFLISERRKFNQRCRQMEKGNVYKSYNSSAAVDIETLKKKESKYSVSSDSGILVNKKQS